MANKKIVFSIGGSIVIPEELDVEFLKKFSGLIKKYTNRIHFSIVVGGGKTARMFQKKRKELGMDEYTAHEIGTKATQLNALFVARLVGGKFSTEHPFKIGKEKGLHVSGGYEIGWTTDTDAAYVAKGMKADYLVNLTDVKGMYTKDPRKHKDAKFLPALKWKEFFKIMGHKIVPGGHYVFDPIAGKVCQKNKIKVAILSKDLHNLENFLKGKRFIGTIIS